MTRQLWIAAIVGAVACGGDGNEPPIADAGDDADIAISQPLTLSGAGSYNPDGSIQRYMWQVLGAPEGSEYRLDGQDTVSPVLTADLEGSYVLGLMVEDDERTRSVPDVVTLTAIDQKPRAVCGSDTTAAVGDTVTLDGEESYHPQGLALSYLWDFDVPDGSKATLDSTSSIAPTFVVDLEGTYLATLTVSDGTLDDSCRQTVTVGDVVGAPMAIIVNPGAVDVGQVVTLDGSKSFDPEGASITHAWSFLTVPSGSVPAFDDASAEVTTFVPDLPGPYEVQLTVSDGALSDSAQLIVDVRDDGSVNNGLPVVDANDDQRADVGERIQLLGSSSDPDGDPLAHTWAVHGPIGSAANAVPTDAARVDFSPDMSGTYVAVLKASDNKYTSADAAFVDVPSGTKGGNSYPEAQAGDNQSVLVGTLVTVDASGSSDPEGDALSYAWTLDLSRASGSKLDEVKALSGADTVSASFTPDVPGEYELEVTVDDGSLVSTDHIMVVVYEAADGNVPPQAITSVAASGVAGKSMVLDGSESIDGDGDTLTYEWKLTGYPSNSALTISSVDDTAAEITAFTPDVAGLYEVLLVVRDPAQALSGEYRTIRVEGAAGNLEPFAHAGDNQVVVAGTKVSLDGSQSSDPEGAALTYRWRLVKPTPSAASLAGDTSATPSFTADVAGVYIVSLGASDGSDEAMDWVSITAVTAGANEPPVALASAPDEVKAGETVTLDASGTIDAEGDPLTLAWTLSLPPQNSGQTTASLNGADTDTATFVCDVGGWYRFTLEVSDGFMTTVDTARIWCDGPETNEAPTAHAGTDQKVKAGEKVILDASKSSDPEGLALTYSWTLSSPIGSTASIDDRSAQATFFVPDLGGTYVAVLRADDGVSSDVDLVTITVDGPGLTASAPVADAGDGQSVTTGTYVTVDGARSYDPSGGSLSKYEWSLATRPQASSATIQQISTRGAAFTADVDGTYVAQLTVTSASGTDTDEVVITATASGGDLAPVAIAGPTQILDLGQTAALDGSASYDPESSALSYIWTVVSVPAGSAVTDADLTSTSTAKTSFVPDVDGTFYAQLTVDDGTASSKDTVEIRVVGTGANTAPIADAGADATVGLGRTAALSALASSDPEGDALTYAWSLVAPVRSSAALSSSSAPEPTFTVDREGEYVVTLQVSDGQFSASDVVVITGADIPNAAPVADAGVDQSVGVGTTAFVDGSASSDADGDALTYAWRFSKQPGASALTNQDLANAENPVASFIPDVKGTFTLELTVSDGVDSAVDTVDVTSGAAASGPSATVTSPVTGTTVDIPYAVIEGTATGDAEVVQVQVGGVDAVATSTGFATWVAYVDLAAGSQTLVVAVEDADGQRNASADSIDVTWDSACIDDTVLFWRADEAEGRDLVDAGPYGISGRSTGSMDWIVGRAGAGLRFDGASFLKSEIDPVLDLETGFTVELWLATAATAAPETIVAKGGTYVLEADGSLLVARVLDASGKAHEAVAVGYNDGAWHHVVIAFDGTTLSLAVDDFVEDATVVASPLQADSAALYVGAASPGTSDFYSGDVDAMRIWPGGVAGADLTASYLDGEPCAVSSDRVVSASASADAGAGYAASNVADGNTSDAAGSYWLLPSGTSGWVEADLGALTGITEVRWVNTHNGGASDAAAHDMRIEVSETGDFTGEQTQIATPTGSVETTLTRHRVALGQPVPGRFVRVWVDTWHGKGGGLGEIEVYGVR